MFGFGLKSRIKKILWKDFKYKCGDLQNTALDFLIKNGKKKLLNEYDYAIFLMFDSMNSLSGIGGDVEQFVKNHISNIEKVMFLAHTPNEHIITTINHLKIKHGIDGLNSARTEYVQEFVNVSDKKESTKSISQEKGFFSWLWTLFKNILIGSTIVILIASIIQCEKEKEYSNSSNDDSEAYKEFLKRQDDEAQKKYYENLSKPENQLDFRK